MGGSCEISVIMPVYNAEAYLKDAIDSILTQTFKDFELIIIDDGSVDNSSKIVLSYADCRIKFYRNEINRGLIYTLNRGISLSNGKYIARMDADDISLPERFEKQVSYMDSNVKCIVCGTEVTPFKGKFKLWFLPKRYQYTDFRIKSQLLRSSCFAHPSVMIRAKVIKDNFIYYNKDYIHAEDYKLWIELLDYGQFHNINERLLLYRISNNQITSALNNKVKMGVSIDKCRKEAFGKIIGHDEKIEKLVFGKEKKYKDIGLLKNFIHDNNLKNDLCYIMYTSLSDYTFRGLLYYVFSGDFLKYDILSSRYIFRKFFDACKQSILAVLRMT